VDVRSLQLFASTFRMGTYCNFLNEVSLASSAFTFILSEGGQFILRIVDLLFHPIFRCFETAAFDSTFFVNVKHCPFVLPRSWKTKLLSEKRRLMVATLLRELKPKRFTCKMRKTCA
jgi:hypothetical protein